MRVIIGAVVLLAASVASADPCPSSTTGAETQRSQAEIQTASDLFQKGKALQSAGKIEEACKLFESSLRLNPQVGIRLNVAECHELQGRLVEAHALFSETAEEAARTGDRRASYAATRKTALEAKLVRVTLKLPETQPPGLALSVGGCPVEPAMAAVPRVVMPGKIAVQATAPGHKPLELEQTGDAGGEVAIEVPALVPYANPEEERKAKEAEALAAIERRKAEQLVTERELVKHYDQHPLRKWTFIGAGVGAAAVVTGAIFGVGARRAQTEYDDKGCGDPTQLIDKAGYDHCLDLRDRGQRDALLGNVLLIGGASVIAAAAIVYVIDPGNVERPRSQLVLSPRGAGLVVRW
jgi:hypothetical protein